MQKGKEKLYSEVKQLIEQAKSFVVQNINTTLVFTNYNIGKIIVEDEQQGSERAKYAEKTLKNLSKKLTKDFGVGYTTRNLELMRKFFLTYSKTKSLISQSEISVSATRKSVVSKQIVKSEEVGITKSPIAQFGQIFKLSWTHYIFLMRINNEEERSFYEIESADNNWSIRELQRQYNSSLYERLALSKNKKAVIELSKNGQIITKPIDMLKEPVVLEFLEIEKKSEYTESQLETAIINKLEKFLLEMGKGFLFQSRQQRISFNGKNFHIDLVFYNRLLKCFVLIDLKIGELTHQNIGQMQMYVNFYDREVKDKDENKTVGIVLCKQANKAVVEFTLPEDNDQIFAREYMLYLPSKKQLQKLLLEKI